MIWRFLTFKRFIFYGFPAYLVSAEYGIRFLLSFAPGKQEDLALIGSTSSVTAAGLSLIAATLIPKPVSLSEDARQALKTIGADALGRGDRRLIFCAVFALFLLPFPWACALWLAHRESTDYDATVFGIHVPGPFLIALVVYGIGIIFTEVKEVV